MIFCNSRIFLVKVTEFENTYKEKILDGVIHREWNIKFNVSTGRVEDCRKEMDVMTFCSKRPDALRCTDITNATIVARCGACEAKIMYNSSLQYYVKFSPIDSHDFTPGEKSHEASNDERLLKTVQGKYFRYTMMTSFSGLMCSFKFYIKT
jgi:hypothetical protein